VNNSPAPEMKIQAFLTHGCSRQHEWPEWRARRRVKEQLKKRGSFEFHKTSFSYIDSANGTEHTVAVPEQGGKGAVSQDPLPPGSVYTAAADSEAEVALFRLEVSLTQEEWDLVGDRFLQSPAENGLGESGLNPPANRDAFIGKPARTTERGNSKSEWCGVRLVPGGGVEPPRGVNLGGF
jgi:hypothetical protein